MARAGRGPSARETSIAWSIIGVLVLIAAGVLVKQSIYDPALFKISPPERPAAEKSAVKASADSRSSAGALDLSRFVPKDLKVLSPPEHFGPETLSDKIDGKAELYLPAGFIGLDCQRFSKVDDPKSWVEIFVYDMGTYKQAFSVYSAQRRSEAEPSDLAPMAYKTKNALYWIHGKYYVEAVASVSSEAMLESIASFGKSFISTVPAQKEEIGEMALFPQKDLVEGSVTLLSTDVFGMEGFENVYTGRYNAGSGELTAFLSRRQSAEEAKKRAEAYHSFLIENGGTDTPFDAPVQGAFLVNIMDTFEIIFYQGPFLAGVHEADSREDAEDLALRLRKKLIEAEK